MNTPAGVAANYLNLGMYKVRLHFWKMLLLAVLAGAFIALAGVGAAHPVLPKTRQWQN